MAPFRSRSVLAVVDFAIENNAGADPGPDGGVENAAVAARRAVASFSQAGRIAIVLEPGGQSESLMRQGRQRHITPSRQIGGIQH